ncbi:MAG: hypothetical protein IJO04_01525 [Oscillospiraceae bacterium]|nr:hypothetical protein [Oscillospiraceae bacterium]
MDVAVSGLCCLQGRSAAGLYRRAFCRRFFVGVYRRTLASSGFQGILAARGALFPASFSTCGCFFEKIFENYKISLCKLEKMGYNDKK